MLLRFAEIYHNLLQPMELKRFMLISTDILPFPRQCLKHPWR
jgi:hypothetical protein